MVVLIPLIHVKINVKVALDINKLIDQLKSKPIPVKDLNINVAENIVVSDNVSVEISSIKPSGSLSMIKTTNNPTPKELEIIQAARANRPYNSISDVRISYAENGSITSVEWTES
ncbi:MAG TPA: hypothetical protein VK712_04410 [Verrucomicrobiae bacterium]|jgi:hypothetical protein|nr:hypothetical protein [Verrucomicrobiae bacterium]